MSGQHLEDRISPNILNILLPLNLLRPELLKIDITQFALKHRMKSQLLYRQLEEVLVAQIVAANRFHKVDRLHLENIADRVGRVEEV